MEFHIFTRERPQLDRHGVPDLSNKLIRGGPVWRDFISGLGANFANVAAPDVYMALERNMIQGVGWPIIGLADASWHQHLNYRIDPGVFSSDVGIVFNSETWGELPDDIRAILTQSAIMYEQDSYRRFQSLTEQLDGELRDLGMQVLRLDYEGAQRYRQLAENVIWDRLKLRSPEYYQDLKSKFHDGRRSIAEDG